MKTIKTLYGGDAYGMDTLLSGDCIDMNLIDEAVSYLLGEHKFINYFKNWSAKKFEIKIPVSQLQFLKMKDYSLISHKIFSDAKIHQYKSNQELQKTIVKLGTKQVIIYTKK